ncbi:ribonuclease P protein component [Aquimarina sp. 2201CG14-23]|uniref:ribonuclease P protein component n=1 Tax=Aquimarina mycalae TaxID=3040073 RepID=UPI002477DD91|nr:ribonuclease P protein component [Aquimarina sp. 2201CG14-23]MDH7446305.1 ribonuclease P protein component [Aquimarina sp. 2201CG14-23]
MKENFGTKEKLKSKKEIELLFSEGKSIARYPIRLIYRKALSQGEVNVLAAVSVSKRNFKKAVDRNRIKRLLRESYRKNKYIVHNNTTHQFTFMFLYTGKEMPDHILIESKIKEILQKFITREIKPT